MQLHVNLECIKIVHHINALISYDLLLLHTECILHGKLSL